MHGERDLARRIGVSVLAQSELGRGVLRGMAHVAASSLWTIIPVRPERALHDLRGAGLHGLIIQAFDAEVAHAMVAEAHCPVVNVALAIAGVPRVAPDDERIARRGVEALVQRGWRRLAYLGVEGFSADAAHVAGFHAGAAAAGVGATVQRFPAGQPLAERLAALTDWLRAQTAPDLPPLGVLSVGDEMGLRLLAVARELGVVVPGRIAVLGCEDDEYQCGLARPALASVILPFESVGREAAALLARLMDGAKQPTVPLLLPPLGVAVRGSLDVAAHDDPAIAAALRHAESIAGATGRAGRSRRGPRVLTDAMALIRASGLGRRTLERRLHAAGLPTPHGLIMAARQSLAERLLRDPSQRIDDIAKRCGYASVAHFSTAFRVHTGAAPSVWRALLR